MQKEDIAKLIDHTLLKPTTDFEDIFILVGQAVLHKFHAICIPSSYVEYARDMVGQHPVSIVSTIGFPLGSSSTASKIAETEQALQDGADELDIVMNIGWFMGKEYDRVLNELSNIIGKCQPLLMSENQKIITKVIIETGLLDDQQKVIATQLANDAGADFVKTSTGFNGLGATADDVRLMLDAGAKEVKASGGVNTYEKLIAMAHAGATRIGTSSGVSILSELDGIASTVSSSDY